jgi:hypothetical protein
MWWSKTPQRRLRRLGFCGTQSAEQALSIYRLLCDVPNVIIIYFLLFFFGTFVIFSTSFII